MTTTTHIVSDSTNGAPGDNRRRGPDERGRIDVDALADDVERHTEELFDAAEKRHDERADLAAAEGEAYPDLDAAGEWQSAEADAIRRMAGTYELSEGAVRQLLENRGAEALRREVAAAEGNPIPTLDDLPRGGKPFSISGPDAPKIDWLIPSGGPGLPPLLARQSVVAHSGDTGAAKSLARVALMVAGLHDQTFMGRPVRARRFMIMNGENLEATERERWAAFGYTDADAASVHYTDRETLGRLRNDVATWRNYVRDEAREFKPDVIDIDTVARAIPVALLDNDAVNELFASTLVPLADELGCAIIIRAHESQSGSARKRGSRASAMLGARAWIDQADGLLTYVTKSPLSESEDDGSVTTRRSFELRVEKMRGAEPTGRPEPFAITGRREADGPLSLELSSDSTDDLDLARLIAAAPGTVAEIAERSGLNRNSSRFKSTRKRAEAEGALVEGPDPDDARRKILTAP